MPEGLSASEVGKEIAEHREHTAAEHAPAEHAQRDRWIAIIEAVLLSVVALLAAWSGYSAAKWGTESSLSLAKASSTRTKASLALIQANQIRTLDSVSFNAAETAYAANNTKLFRLDLNRMRPGYRPAVDAWLALHPLKNPNAPPDPSYMPQYRIPQQAAGLALSAQADAYFKQASQPRERRTSTCASPSSWPPSFSSLASAAASRSARRVTGWSCVAGVLLVVSVVQLLSLPGPPS